MDFNDNKCKDKKTLLIFFVVELIKLDAVDVVRLSINK